MNDDLEGPDRPPAMEAAHLTGQGPVSRRRMLLRSVGKGTAIIGAAAPIQTLLAAPVFAPGQPGAGQLCTISGTQSAVHSQRTSITYCGGYSSAFWGTKAVTGP